MVNSIPFEYSTSWSPNDLCIPKNMWLRSERRLLTFREILESGVGRFTRANQYEQAGIDVIDHTREEITALTTEMVARRNGTWCARPEDEELQRRFWAVFRRFTTYYTNGFRTHRLIGAAFLREHAQLLEDRTAPPATVVCQR